MKKVLLFIPLLAASLTASAQYVEVGLRGGLDSFWLLNSNTSIAHNSETKAISLSYDGGVHLAYDITDNIGIEANVMYAQLNQAYRGSFSSSGMLPDESIYTNGESYTSKTTLTATQIPLMLCLETNSGSFIELGAQYDMINGANYTGTFDYPSNMQPPSTTKTYSVANNFVKSYFSGVFGVGGKYYLNNNFCLYTDFRVTYAFNDVRGVDGVGQDYNSSPYYQTTKPTTAVNASFNLGFIYMILANKGYKVGHRCKGTPQVRSGTSHPR